MLDRARDKTTASFYTETLPALSEGTYDVIVAIRGVVNHLPPNQLTPALETMADRLAPAGLVVFDTAALPPSGNDPALDVDHAPHGSDGRNVQMTPREDGRLDWQSIVCLPKHDEWFVNSRPVTPFSDERIEDSLSACGFSVSTHDGFGEGDNRTVFVATL